MQKNALLVSALRGIFHQNFAKKLSAVRLGEVSASLVTDKQVKFSCDQPPMSALLMLCLHLKIYRGPVTDPWYIPTVFIPAQITQIYLSTIMITTKSNWWELENAHFYQCEKRWLLKLIEVITFYFFFFERQTCTSTFQQLL